jgi:hypothetical protein
VAAWNPIAIRYTAFRRQAVSINNTGLKFASFFRGHGEMFDHG